MGAGETISHRSAAIGLNVTCSPAENIASPKIWQPSSTIVLGIRAYDTREELVARTTAKLLDYVQQGGTLIVQYNAGSVNSTADTSRPIRRNTAAERVSVEEAPGRDPRS